MRRRNAERDVIVVERGGSSFWWLLVGGAVGAGVALLLAPQSGEKTRQRLGLKIAALKDSAREAIDELSDAIDPVTAVEEGEDIEEGDSEGGGKAGGRAGDTRVGGSSARRELERRLAVARARRHRALADEDEEPVA